MRIPKPKPHDDWWPQNPDGPTPPLWFYFAQRWHWVAIWATCGVLIALEAVTSPPGWLQVALTSLVWFLSGIQTRGIWDEQQARKLKMRRMLERHEMRMGLYDRRMELHNEAVKNGYGLAWLEMRGVLDPMPPYDRHYD